MTLCWNCEGVIPAGEGRVKDGFRVHDLCPPPQPILCGDCEQPIRVVAWEHVDIEADAHCGDAFPAGSD